MPDPVVIEFVGDTSQLEPTIKILASIGAIDKKVADDFVTNSQKITESIKAQQQAHTNLGAASVQGAEKTKAAYSQLNDQLSNLESQIKSVASAIGIGFGVAEIINFSKETVNLFAEREKGEQQLLFALNNRKDAQEKLLQSAKELGKANGLDPDSIVKQQAFLAVQGKSEDQIKKTTQAAIELSAVTGEDLASSVFKLSATYEGNIGRLARLDERFKDFSKTELENGAAIDLINEKYKGFSESTLNTTAGKLKAASVEVEELKKQIGEELAPALVNVESLLLNVASDLVNAFSPKTAQDGISEAIQQIKKTYEADKSNTKESLQDEKTKSHELETQLQLHIKVLEAQHASESTIQETVEKIHQQRILQEALRQLIRDAGDDSVIAVAKQVNSLETLKAKLADLKSKQEGIIDPLGAGSGANAENLSQQKDIQKQIDEITGKAQEERDKAAKIKKEHEEKAFQEYFKQITDENQKIADIDYKNNQDKAKAEEKGFRDFFKQITDENEKEVNEDYKKFVKKQKAQEDFEKKRAIIIDAAVKATEQGIIDIYTKSIDNQITLINQLKDAELSAIDEKIQANQDAVGKELISKRAGVANDKKLQAEKLQIEKDMQKKINELKHQQDVANKIQKIFDITLATAKAIAEALSSPELIPFIAGLGAIELAAAIAAPLPKYHKGRLAINNSMEELAIIRKDETITDPKKSKEYAATLNAIHSGKVPAIVLNDFVKNFRLKGSAMNNIHIDYSKMAFENAWAMRDHKDVMRNGFKYVAKAIEDNKPKAWDLRRA